MSLVLRSCAVAVAVFLLGGCADDDEGLSGAKSRVAEQANPICAETRQKVGDLGGDPAAERDALQSAADRLKALPIPGEDEAQYIVFRTHVQNMALNLDDLAQSREVQSPDRARADTALSRAREANELAKEAAAEYGLVECAQGFTQ